jgi:dienelactone hydrolase
MNPTLSDLTALSESTVDYREGETPLEGFSASPAAFEKKVPLVVVVHEWMGLDEYSKRRARMLAELGYVAFSADLYGKGVRPKDREEAGRLVGKYRGDLPLLRRRISAAIESGAKLPHVDPSRIAVIGYCFGGSVALEAARARLPISVAVSFHGGLSTPNPEETKNLKAKIAVYHGAEDPAIPPEEVAAFFEEMRRAKADWEFTAYGGTVHKFTNPEAPPYRPGAVSAYNPVADRRSWESMLDLFREVFGEAPAAGSRL